MRFFKILFTIFIFSFLSADFVYAQEVRFEAVIVKEYESETGEKMFDLNVVDGEKINQQISINNSISNSTFGQQYRVGDRVVITQSLQGPGGKPFYYIVDFVRVQSLYILTALFLLITVIVAGKQGVGSIIGMIYSFFILFKFILPRLFSGADPVLIAIMGAFLILPVTFVLSHGFNKKTVVAMIGTITALTITGFLAKYFINLSRLTGYASEEVSFLQATNQGAINPTGLLMAGIIIGLIGILDDITVSQASIVFKLKEVGGNIPFRQLYFKAMDVGRDHIGSLVNTLVIVYAGASLPLLMLFNQSTVPAIQVINYEIVAEEVIRMLVASIGLVLAVPITTFIAVIFAKKL